MKRRVAVDATPIAAAKAPHAMANHEMKPLRDTFSSFLTAAGAGLAGGSGTVLTASAIIPLF